MYLYNFELVFPHVGFGFLGLNLTLIYEWTRKAERGDTNMKETLRLELFGSVQLIASIILVLLWSVARGCFILSVCAAILER
jgi:hypothetical protein